MVSSNKEKKKILYIITKSNFGGAQRYVYDLAVNLPKKDFEIAVAMGGDGALKDKLEDAGIKTIMIDRLGRDVNIFDDAVVFFNLFKLLREEKLDIVHLNSSKIGGLGALAARFARVPRIVFTAHGWAFNEARNDLQKMAIKLLSWLTVFLCHSVITVSEHDGRQGRKMPFVSKKIIVVHNGISEINFKNKEESRNDLLGNLTSGLNKETIWLGTIGELHKNKGAEYAIQALVRLTKDRSLQDCKDRSFTGFFNFILVIIGEGEERENLENLIKKEKLEKNIFLVGYKENAPSLLKAFDVFLLPSVKEGLPYVLLEAGVASLPSIASATGGIPEIIDDMESGILIKPKNSKEIAKAITYFEENKAKMKEFGQELHKKITKVFSTNQMLEKTMKIYRF